MFKKVLHTLSRTNVVVYFPIINMINYVSNLRINFSKRKDKKMWYACQYNKYLQFFYANNQRSKNSFFVWGDSYNFYSASTSHIYHVYGTWKKDFRINKILTSLCTSKLLMAKFMCFGVETCRNWLWHVIMPLPIKYMSPYNIRDKRICTTFIIFKLKWNGPLLSLIQLIYLTGLFLKGR